MKQSGSDILGGAGKRLQGRARKGFTLVELLIVISIIGMLTVLAVGNYIGVEQQARVEFATDTLVSTIREAQVMARSGQRSTDSGGQQVLQCYVVKIVTGTGVTAGLYFGQGDYLAVQGDTVDSCQTVGDENLRKSEVFNEKVIIVGDGGEKTYYFKPPFAQILEQGGGQLVAVQSQKLQMTVQDVDSPEYSRAVIFDLATGEVKRI